MSDNEKQFEQWFSSWLDKETEGFDFGRKSWRLATQQQIISDKHKRAMKIAWMAARKDTP